MVYVLGANGFIGKNICIELSTEKLPFIAFDRFFDLGFFEAHAPDCERVIGDFDGLHAMRVFGSEPADFVMLISGSTPATFQREPSKEIECNLLPYTRFFESVPKGSRLIFLSSGGTIYGRTELDRPIREDGEKWPISSYGLTKLVIERYLQFSAAELGLKYVILRPANPFGPWSNPQRLQGLIPVLLNKIARKGRVEIWGDGMVVRDYFDVRDLAYAVRLILEDRSMNERIFNIGSGIGRNIREVIRTIEEIIDVPFSVDYRSGRHFDVPYNVLDIDAVSQELNWRLRIDFEQSVLDTWNYLQQFAAYRAK